jgi:biopolymer transport protein ExbD
MIKKYSRRRMKQYHGFEISLTPLLDTVLVLLMIFILAIPGLEQVLKISLPKANTTDVIKKKDTSVFCFAINQYGKLFLKNKKEVYEKELIKAINAEMSLNTYPYMSIVLFADKDVLFDTVMRTVTVIKKETGVKDIYVKTKKISF